MKHTRWVERVAAFGSTLLVLTVVGASRIAESEVEQAPSNAKVALPRNGPATPEERLAEIRAELDAARLQSAERKARQLHGDAGLLPADFRARVLDAWVESLWRSRRSREDATLRWALEAIALKEFCGASPAERAVSFLNLAYVHRTAYRYEAARRAGRNALDLLEGCGQSQSALAAEITAELGAIAIMNREHDRALALLHRADSMYAALPDAPPIARADVLNALGATHGLMNNYAEARKIHERALGIRLTELGPDHPRTAESYNNLGAILSQLGDIGSALPMYERVVEIRSSNYGVDAPLTLHAMSNLAFILRSTGRFDEARGLYEYVLSRLDPQKNTLDHAEARGALAQLDHAARRFDVARAGLVDVLATFERVLGPRHFRTAYIGAALAAVHYETGSLEEAERLCREALDIRVRADRQRSPEMAQDLLLLAAIVAKAGRADEAFDLALRAENIAATHLALSAQAMSRSDALRYATVRARGADLLVLLAARTSPHDAAREARTARAWEAFLGSRAIVLSEMIDRHRDTARSAAPAVQNLRRRWLEAAERVSSVAFSSELDHGTRARALAGAQDALRAIERELAEATLAVAPRQRRDVRLADIAEAVPADAAMVAYAVHGVDPLRAERTAMCWLRETYSEGRQLIAWVLTSRGTPRLIDLGAMSEVEQRVATWLSEASQGLAFHGRQSEKHAEEAYRRQALSLRQRIWDPLHTSLRGAQRVFVVPDGALQFVSHAALPDDDNGYLVDAGLKFHYLTAERDLIPLEDTQTGHGVLAFGGADFDTVHDDGRADVAVAAPEDSRLALRGVDARCPELAQLQFDPLPNSLSEVQGLKRLWRSMRPEHAPEPIVLTGTDARDTAFKLLAPGRRILHLATHGFFLGDGCPGLAGTRGIVSRGPSAAPLPEDPFLQSGLAFAGANARASTGDLHADGILTAEEIAAMNLQGVEWAVLSACDTGRGHVQASEGVLGLRRAFRVAGVRTVITSLWAVADEPTREWMQQLYEARLDRGRDTVDAVHEATARTLRARRERGESTHPFYWAGFVGSGAWK